MELNRCNKSLLKAYQKWEAGQEKIINVYLNRREFSLLVQPHQDADASQVDGNKVVKSLTMANTLAEFAD